MHAEMPFYLLATILGVLAHHGVFIRGEWHLRAPTVVMFHIAFAACIWGIWNWQHPGGRYRGFGTVAGLASCYILGLFSSITIYRIFFHRLRHFPGPRLAAVTKLWHVFQCRDSRNHLVLDSMHKQYGNFVRTGNLKCSHSLHLSRLML